MATDGGAPRPGARASGLSTRFAARVSAEAFAARRRRVRLRGQRAGPRRPPGPRKRGPAERARAVPITASGLRGKQLLARRERPQGKSATRLCNLGIKGGSGRLRRQPATKRPGGDPRPRTRGGKARETVRNCY